MPRIKWGYWSLIAMVVVGSAFLATLVSVIMNPGGPDLDSLPVFAYRSHYVLTYHGNKMEVSRDQYLFNYLAFMTAWFSFSICAGIGTFAKARQARLLADGH